MATTTTNSVTTAPTESKNVSYVDVAGLMSILQNYLVSSPLIQNQHGDQLDTSTELQTIHQNLNQISNALSSNTSGNILSQQTGVDAIVSNEMNRLQLKKDAIDSALTTQQRMMQVNDTYIKRQRQYVKMLVAVSVSIVIMIFLSYFTFMYPEWNALASIVYVILIVSTFIYCFWTYYAMIQRDPIEYDRLNMQQVPFPVNDKTYGTKPINSAGDTNVGYCAGEDCCNSPGVVWDASKSVCVMTTTPSVTPSSAPVKAKEGFTPYTPDEQSTYILLPRK